VRSDKQLNPRFTASRNWSHNRGPGGELKNLIPNEEGSQNLYTAFSHSGNERNRLFLNQRGKKFVNVSGTSGVDSALDGRAFVHWDFNRDGLTDIAVVNANSRLLHVFENQSRGENHFIAIRLLGHFAREENAPASSRDAIGARIVLGTESETILRTVSCGEGFASQNSKTLLIGIGAHPTVKHATIHWPSGKSVQINDLEAGKLVTIDESKESPSIEDYCLDGLAAD
jgi:hypothetical protein